MVWRCGLEKGEMEMEMGKICGGEIEKRKRREASLKVQRISQLDKFECELILGIPGTVIIENLNTKS